MEISIYLPALHMLRYMEISMYLASKHMARYMEISMYLATCLLARYMEMARDPVTASWHWYYEQRIKYRRRKQD